MIKESGRSEEGNDRFLLEENFEQAVHYANTCVTPRPISKHVQVRLKIHFNCQNLTFPTGYSGG